MQYRKLGRTGVEVSRLCLGCMMFGGKTDQPTTDRMIARFVELGGNFLDTANVYSRGKSEEFTGRAVRSLGNRQRDDLFIATKVHGRMKDGDHQPNRYGNHRRMIIEECHASLRRLQVDYIDLYQIHRPQNAVPIDETLRALDDLVRQGKVRYLGTSTFAAWQVVESLWVSKELGLNRLVTEQPPYNLLDRRVERELIPMAQTFGLGIIPWSPLAGGFLTGKYRRGDTPKDARIQPGWGPGKRADKMLGNELAYKVIDKLDELAKARGATVGQVALAWVRDQPGVTAPIIGPRTPEQLEENLACEAITLADDDRKAIDELAAPGDCIAPFYTAEFGPHEQRAIV